MQTLYSPKTRLERLIATGRLVLAASSLFAVWLDPSEPAKHASFAYGLLAAYLAYAILVAVLVWRAEAPTGVWRLVTHAFDLCFFTLFVYFTAGPASPFVAYFVFSLICATLRWQRQGTLWTALAALSMFLAVGMYFGEVLRDPTFELFPFIVRGVYLAVVAVLLGYVGAYEQATRREMSLLAEWPREVPRDAETLVRQALQYSARVFDAPRATLVWTDREEPWLVLASWDGRELDVERDASLSLGSLVAEPLARSHFLCLDAGAAPASVLHQAGHGVLRWRGEPLPSFLVRRWAARTILSLRLEGETHEGRLFILDREELTADDLVLGEIVASVVAARLDHLYLTQRLQQAAATEERIRLARDLHDGVLQSFTGIALRLAAIRRSSDDDQSGALAQLEEIQRLIALEQRDLRFFIQELKPPVQGSDGEAPALTSRLDELARRIEQEWGPRVELHATELDGTVSEALARHVYHIVREALVNAVRHGGASRIAVNIELSPTGEIAIRVSDNGSGFPFEGKLDADDLASSNHGPKNLRERVASLDGSITIESGRSGALLDIILPTGDA